MLYLEENDIEAHSSGRTYNVPFVSIHVQSDDSFANGHHNTSK